MSSGNDLIDALGPVVNAFDQIGIRYYVGGSVASSYHGAVRSTMDVDLLGEISETHVSSLLTFLGDEYYASETAIREAIRRSASFNLIHLASSFKVDVFVSGKTDFERNALNRATTEMFGSPPTLPVKIATAEDIIVAKLQWYRLGNETSDRQWNDLTRLRDLLQERLDVDYVKKAAASVDVLDLATRLIQGE